jgi:hypothetical protein
LLFRMMPLPKVFFNLARIARIDCHETASSAPQSGDVNRAATPGAVPCD